MKKWIFTKTLKQYKSPLRNSAVLSRAFIVVAFFIAALFQATTGQAQIISTIAGGGSSLGDGGPATAAQFSHPNAIAVDVTGNKYIADYGNRRVRKIDLSGNISTVAGDGINGYSGDSSAATDAELQTVEDVAVDAAGNLYIACTGSNVIRMVNTTGIITTIVGNGTGGYSGDNGAATAAELSGPSGVAVDVAGNIYVADAGNYCVRKVDVTGNISTIAGSPTVAGYSGSGGPATAAQLGTLVGVKVDVPGNVYISDIDNSVIWKVNTAGTISIFAGNGSQGSMGDGGPATDAEFSTPKYMSIDAVGSLYIADVNNDVIRKIDISGNISSVAGMIGSTGYSGDGGPATAAQLDDPTGVAVDATGNMYIADRGSSHIRMVTPPPCYNVIAGTIINNGNTSFCGSGSDTLTLTGASAISGVTYQWLSSTDGVNYTNSGTTDTSLLYATGTINTTMYYKAIVSCSSTNTSFTDSTTADTITVNAIVVPSISITASPGISISAGQTVTYTATITNGGNAPTYQWQKNGVDITGATANSYATSMLANNDVITCVVHSTALCAVPDSALSNQLLMQVTTGVASIAGINYNIRVSPNPNNGTFSITGSINDSKEAQIEVLNVIGQVVYQASVPVYNGNIKQQVQLSNENANGIYLLRVTTGNGSSIMRFVVER